jgi:hypothetical protein
MKYRLSFVAVVANLLVLQDEMTTDPIRSEAVIRDNFFIVEVDCCFVIRTDNPEVILFGLYLPALIKQK